MTIIAYDGKTKKLYADSGEVYNYNASTEYLMGGAQKIFVSPCRKIAIATTGFANDTVNREIIADFLLSRIAIYNETKDPAAFKIKPADKCRIGLASQTIVGITKERAYVYHASENGGYSDIQVCGLDDVLCYGRANLFVMAAYHAGRSMEDAMMHGVRFCDYSLLPITSFDTTTLNAL